MGFQLETESTLIENFKANSSEVQANTTYIVGDGGEDPFEVAIFNDKILPVPNSFNGAEGHYWDKLNKDVNTFINPGDVNSTATIKTYGDYLVLVAQVFSITSTTPLPSRGIDIATLFKSLFLANQNCK